MHKRWRRILLWIDGMRIGGMFVDNAENTDIGFFDGFERNLTVWVILCMTVGVVIGGLSSSVPAFLGRFDYANVSALIAVLIWVMIIN